MKHRKNIKMHIQAMDYRITDAVADPLGLTDRWHTEKPIRVPGSFLCYNAPEDAPEVSDLPIINACGITFAYFNNRAKKTVAYPYLGNHTGFSSQCPTYSKVKSSVGSLYASLLISTGFDAFISHIRWTTILK